MATQAVAQMHFVRPQSILPADIRTGVPSVDSKIKTFFAETTDRLSYNYNWTSHSLDQGIHKIDQTIQLTIDAQVAQASRAHQFVFEIKTQEVNGEIVIMVDWVVTDKEVPATLHGTVALHRISKNSLGTKQDASAPEEEIQSDGSPGVRFVFPPRSGSAGGSQTFQIQATRGYMSSDGTYHVEGYTVTVVVNTGGGILPGDDRLS